MLTRILLFLAVVTRCPGFEVDEFMNSVLAIKAYFRSGCLYFVNFKDNEMAELVQFVDQAKKVFTNNIALGVLKSLSDLNYLYNIRCTHNSPIIVLHQRERDIKTFLKQVSVNIDMSNVIWLLFLNENTSMELEEFFQDINIPFNCEFLLAHGNTTLLEIYRVGPNHPLQTYHFGKWSNTRGFILSSLSLYERRNNLFGFQMKIGLRKDMLTELVQRPNGISFSDLLGELWDILEIEINVTSKYFLPQDDPTGGDKNDNGTWTGVFGMFQRKEVDICYAPFSMTSKRMEVVDFSLPVLEIKTYLVIKKPITYELKWKIFLMSFTKESWIAIGVIMLALPVVYKMVGNIGRRYKEKRSYDINHIDAILITVTAFLQQGHSNVPKNTSLRLIFATVYLTAYFVLTCFSAAFITQMTLRSPDLPFNNFEEFLKDGTYHLGLLRKSAQMDYFKKSNVTLLQKIYKKMIAPYETTMDVNDKDGLERICNVKKYAYMVSTFSLMKKIYQPSCNIAIIPRAFYPGTIAISAAKASPYLGLINYKLQSLRNSRKLKELHQKYSFKIPVYEEDHSLAVNLYDAAPILIMLVTGITIAFIIFLAEYIFYHIM